MAKYIGAIGVAVSNLDASLEFYTSMIGMVELQRMELPSMQQVVLGFEGVRGPSVLLMRHNDTSVNTKDNPIKLVFYVPDTAGMLEEMRAANYVIHMEAKPIDILGGAIVGFAKDPDGYLVELVQKPPKKSAG